MRRKIMVLCLVAFLILSCPMTAFAKEGNIREKGEITLTLTEPTDKQPIKGAEFEVYYVASGGMDAYQNLFYAYTSPFWDCDFSLKDPELVEKLSAYVEEKAISSVKITTDADGKAVCGDLALGLYLVKQTKVLEGFSLCTPFLVTVPMKTEAGFEYSVNAAPKTDIVREVSITIKKVWNTGKSATIPASVSVQLLRGSEVVETAVLNKDNNWQITYKDMPQSDAYSIKEVNVPKGFTATYGKNQLVFTVTNTASLAQTGQLIWPIPVLAAAGLFFLIAGFVLLGKPRKVDA